MAIRRTNDNGNVIYYTNDIGHMLNIILFLQSLLLLLVMSRSPGPLLPGEKKPKMHKLVEAVSIIYLLLHMWSGYFQKFI